MRHLNSALMSTQQPAFKQRHHSIYQWQEVISNVRFFPDNGVRITQGVQLCITSPVVCAHHGPWLNTLLYSTAQTLSRCVQHSQKANSPYAVTILLGGNNDQSFPGCPTTTLARLFTTDISLVHLYNSGKTITARPNHCITQFVQPNPGGSVTAQSQDTLQAKSANSVFLIRYVPDGPKPKLQWLPRILKNGPRCYRTLMLAFLAVIKPASSLPSLRMITTRTTKTFRPPKSINILQASLFCTKFLLKFHDCLRVFFHTRLYYILWPLESSA